MSPAPPIGEAQRVVVVALALGPHVVGLVHHGDAQAVARGEHRPTGRVVGAADRVEPGRLEQLDPALLGPVDRGRPDRPVVVVYARAAQLDGLAVDPQSVARVELEPPHPERRVARVER